MAAADGTARRGLDLEMRWAAAGGEGRRGLELEVGSRGRSREGRRWRRQAAAAAPELLLAAAPEQSLSWTRRGRHGTELEASMEVAGDGRGSSAGDGGAG